MWEIKHYLQSNLMASQAPLQLDTLFAEMQVHVLDLTDGFAMLKTALTAESLATKSWLMVEPT